MMLKIHKNYHQQQRSCSYLYNTHTSNCIHYTCNNVRRRTTVESIGRPQRATKVKDGQFNKSKGNNNNNNSRRKTSSMDAHHIVSYTAHTNRFLMEYAHRKLISKWIFSYNFPKKNNRFFFAFRNIIFMIIFIIHIHRIKCMTSVRG